MSFADYWQSLAESYTADLSSPYHRHRLAVIDALIPRELWKPARRVFDFGCGDGSHVAAFLEAGTDARGCDESSTMMGLAHAHLERQGHDPDRIEIGGVELLADIDDGSLDGVVSFNVLAYLSAKEDEDFYRFVSRALKPGGWLVVTHSNELFDLFTLNSRTLDFFVERLDVDSARRPDLNKLLSGATQEVATPSYGVRENPLTYADKLARFGLEEMRQEFINRHDLPPALLPRPVLEHKTYPDTLSVPASERWKLMFQCSTFGSVARKRAA